jgi:spermidine synthase
MAHPTFAPCPARATPFALVLALFFVSGASGLVYEVLWTRRLTLVFGSGLVATSAVLATFMGGLALGAWLLGRAADRGRSPFALYGWLEIGVGLYALAVPVLLAAAIPLYQVVYRRWDGAPGPVNLARALLSAAIFLVPTVLMGGTLPALSRFVVREIRGLGEHVGRLYAVNTWGAVAGCLLAGFLLIEALGLRGLEILTAGANLAVGAVAVALGRRQGRAPSEAPRGGGAPEVGTAARGLVLAALALSGFAALGYEVVWARFLTFFMGNSTYAFTAMLGTFLVGLAAGAALAARRVDRLAEPLLAFAWVELAVGTSMAAGMVVYPLTPELAGMVAAVVPGGTWAEWIAVRFTFAFAVLLVPTFFLGTTFPLAGRIYVSDVSRVGSQVGTLYAANTLGAILGSLASGFALIPGLGFRNTVVALVALNAVVAAAVALRGTAARRVAAVLASAALAAGAAVALPDAVFLSTIRRVFPREEIVYYREFPSATVFVTRSPEAERWVHFSDKRASGGTMNLPGHRFWGHLPALLADRRDTACVICFGSGITVGSVARHPFDRIVCAEICEGIREPARFFPENHGVLDDPRVRLVTDDGRNVLLGTAQTFDVIVSEPPLLETAGVVNLFTREFYELVRERLAPGGVFCQWVPSFEFSRPQHALVLRTFLEVFPEATLWGSPLYADTVLVGSRGPARLDFAEIARRMAEPAVARDLAESGIADPLELLSWFAVSAPELRAYCGPGPVLSDDRTVLDFVMPRERRRATTLRPVTFWKRPLALSPDLLRLLGREPVAPLVQWPDGAGGVPERLERLERARRLLLKGHEAGVLGSPAEQARLYEQALAVAPDFTTARYYVALRAIEQAEAAARQGDLAPVVGLVSRAAPLARGFAHLERRLEVLSGALARTVASVVAAGTWPPTTAWPGRATAGGRLATGPRWGIPGLAGDPPGSWAPSAPAASRTGIPEPERSPAPAPAAAPLPSRSPRR